jgi:hypothetical protein
MLFFGHQPNRWLTNEDEEEKETFDHVCSANDSQCHLEAKKTRQVLNQIKNCLFGLVL